MPSAAETRFITIEFGTGSRICTTASPSGAPAVAGGTGCWRIVPEAGTPPAASAILTFVLTPLDTCSHAPSLNDSALDPGWL